jgi:hypothetical protein
MRLRLLALTLVPLVGMTAFAFLWTSGRYERASDAERERKTTQIVTELSALSDNLAIENSLSSLNPTSKAASSATAFTGGAHTEITRLRAELAGHATDIDRLADRKGSWAKLDAQVDALARGVA